MRQSTVSTREGSSCSPFPQVFRPDVVASRGNDPVRIDRILECLVQPMKGTVVEVVRPDSILLKVCMRSVNIPAALGACRKKTLIQGARSAVVGRVPERRHGLERHHGARMEQEAGD